jgi:hypothetical protein
MFCASFLAGTTTLTLGFDGLRTSFGRRRSMIGLPSAPIIGWPSGPMT